MQKTLEDAAQEGILSCVFSVELQELYLRSESKNFDAWLRE